MRTIYRRVDMRDASVSEQVLSLIQRLGPDLVILETDNVRSLHDVVDCHRIWSSLDNWHIIFAIKHHESGSTCVYIGSPWELQEIPGDDAAAAPFRIGSIQVSGPRPGIVRPTWPPEPDGIDIEVAAGF